VAATEELCRSFLDLWWHFDPAAATAGRLGDFDPDSIRQHVAALRSIAGGVEELEIEDLAEEIDRTALLDHLRVLLYRFEHEHPYQSNPLLWTEQLAMALAAPLEHPDGDEVAAAAALERLRALPRFARAAEATLRRPALLLVDAALEELEAVSDLLERCAARFGPGWETAGVESGPVVAEARSAIQGFAGALRGRIEPDPAAHAGAIGETEVDRRLHHEHASIHNSAEVWRGALRLAAGLEEEVTDLAAELDPSRSWREVYERVNDGSRAGADRLQGFRDHAGRARQFAESQGFMDPGPSVPLEVQPLAGAARVLESIAVYRVAGPGPAAVLLGEPDPAAFPWLAARLAEPGLHLLESRADRLPGAVRRHISASSTPGGWALYAQAQMAELGFEPEPGPRLVERVLLLREVHLAIVDLGLHTRQLTTREALAQLTDGVPSDSRTALTDVRRLLSRPLSASAAILGWQELMRLREDYRAARGDGKDRLAGFHEELFSYGGLPVPLIRWGMGIDS